MEKFVKIGTVWKKYGFMQITFPDEILFWEKYSTHLCLYNNQAYLCSHIIAYCINDLPLMS